MEKYDKVLIYQYGKVGSSSLREAVSKSNKQYTRKYYPTIQEKYNEKILQVHCHEVAKDILSKYKNVLVINIVRLPIDRNISGFFQTIDRTCKDFSQRPISEIINIYDRKHSVKSTSNWMINFYKVMNIDIDKFKFDITSKYNKLRINDVDILSFKFEDLEYVISNILPDYDLIIKKKKNEGSKKSYNEIYKNFKESYKVNQVEKENILNCKITNIYYSKEEILKHINKYS